MSEKRKNSKRKTPKNRNKKILLDLNKNFEGCLSSVSKTSNKQEFEDSLSKFMEAAQQLHSNFLALKTIITETSPSQAILQEVEELKEEKERKDVCIDKANQKVEEWKKTFSETHSSLSRKNQTTNRETDSLKTQEQFPPFTEFE